MKTYDFKLVTLGADPEFFIVDKYGKIMPARLFTDGTKENPEDMGDGYFLSWDNVTLEGNIPPATNREEFITNMQTLKEIIRMRVEPFGGKILYENSMRIPDKIFRDPTYKVVGCDIDFCVHNAQVKRSMNPHTGKINPDNLTHLQPVMRSRLKNLAEAMNHPIRFAGFHLHFGVGKTCDGLGGDFSSEYLLDIISHVDRRFVEFMSKHINLEKDNRHKVYGEGMFRPKQYGFEYRSIGSYFAKDKFLGEIYDIAFACINEMSEYSLDTIKTVKY